LQGPPKFTQSGIFGLKIYHLATLVVSFFPEKVMFSSPFFLNVSFLFTLTYKVGGKQNVLRKMFFGKNITCNVAFIKSNHGID
jgi:hypothetical protein